MSHITVLDKPNQIVMFHWLQVKYALKIQVDTGMRHSKGSLIKQANKMLGDGANHRTAKQAYAAVCKKIEELNAPNV